MFVYELSGCRFKYRCSHLNFWLRACFEQEVPWYSGNYRVWIHSEKRTRHDKNIQSRKKIVEIFLWLNLLVLINISLKVDDEGSPNSLTGVLFHWKIKTGGVLIHRWIKTGGVLNLGSLNSPLHGPLFAALQVILVTWIAFCGYGLPH